MSERSDSPKLAPQSTELLGAFWRRRVHSLIGVFIVLFLIEHLITNSQAALWIGEDGRGFIQAVDIIYRLPYLRVIEITLLLVPFLVHIVWGLRSLKQTQMNIIKQDGYHPYAPYARNYAYSWQRISAWLLILGIGLHVLHMRILRQPTEIERADGISYVCRVTPDEGIATLAERLGIEMWNLERVDYGLEEIEKKMELYSLNIKSENPPLSTNLVSTDLEMQKFEREFHFMHTMKRLLNRPDDLIIVTPDMGRAMLFVIRDVFKSIGCKVIYSLLVLFAVFHAFNGLWSALITWGITATLKAQRYSLVACYGLMIIFISLGFCSIWLSYSFNLVR